MDIDLAERQWVLLPGTLCSGRVFDAFLDGLAVPEAARHTIRLRHPRVEDYAPEMIAACEAGAVVCGFSLGAIVAAHLADRLPARAFVLFGLNPHADAPDKRAERLGLERDVASLGGAKALASRLPDLAGSAPEATQALILAMATDSGGDIAAHTELALSRPGALGPLSRTQVPVSLFTGTRDTATPLAVAETAAKAAPHGRLVPLQGLGHYALVEDPAACCRAVADSFDPKQTNLHGLTD